jgi:signal transduction histidine kinase
VKYSGVTDFEVHVTADAGQVQLVVSDSGRGFVPEKAIQRGGIGLISMQERMKLINGTLDIVSNAQQGTQITARAPLG